MSISRRPFFIGLIAVSSLLFAVQLATGIWLFAVKLGMSPGALTRFYLGDPAAFIAPRTVDGLLETAVPHCVAMGVSALAFAHFLPFSGVSDRRAKGVALALFAAAAGEIVTPFLILAVSPLFVWLKIAAFAIFEGGIVTALLLLLAASLQPRG